MNETLTPAQFLEEMFEFEYCAECHGDVIDHDVMWTILGTYFAKCKNDAVCHVEDCDYHNAGR